MANSQQIGPRVASVLTSGTTPPADVTIVSASEVDFQDATGAWKKQTTVIYTQPSGWTGDGVWCYRDAPDSSINALLPEDGTIPADGTHAAVAAFNPKLEDFFGKAVTQVVFYDDPPTSPEFRRVYLTSGSSTVQVKPIQNGQAGASPSFQYLSVPTASGPTGREVAPLIRNIRLSAIPAGWAANPNIVVADSGDQSFEIQLDFDWPLDDPSIARLGGANWLLDNGKSQKFVGTNAFATSGAYFPLALQSVMPGVTAYKLEAESYDIDGNKNSFVPSVTPSYSFSITRQDGAAGSEKAPNATGVTFTITQANGADGTAVVDALVAGTDPDTSANPQFGGYFLEIQRPSDTIPRIVIGARNLPLHWQGQMPAAVESWIFSLVAIDTNNRANTIVPGVTPQLTTNVGSTAGLLRLNKVDLTFVGPEFSISSGLQLIITPGGITTPKLTTGQLDIGGGGGKPIRFRVYDALGSGIGWIGDDTANTGFVGAWFKIMRLGGATPSLAPIRTDTAGAVTIDGAVFTLTQNSLVTTLNNATDTVAGPVSLRSHSTTSSRDSTVSGDGFFIRASDASTYIGQLQAPGDAAILKLAKLGTGNVILAQTGGAGSPFVDVNDGTNHVRVSAGSIAVNGIQVLGPQQTGPGNTTDTSDCGVRFNVLLGRLRTLGMIT
jgi:hypothetical protein